MKSEAEDLERKRRALLEQQMEVEVMIKKLENSCKSLMDSMEKLTKSRRELEDSLTKLNDELNIIAARLYSVKTYGE